MKLFTKEIDKKLFAQFGKGSDLENQMVFAKIFNPYGRGVWYIMNSDENDADYLWAIVDLFEVEMGSVSRSELESLKVPPFGLGLERDLYFRPINAKELYEGLLRGKMYEKGGETAMDENKEMLSNLSVQLKHHIEELSSLVPNVKEVEPWVLGKLQRAATDLSDTTHYLDGEKKNDIAANGVVINSQHDNQENVEGGMMDDGGMMDNDDYSIAKLNAFDTIDWEDKLKEYAGENYDSLTREEREDIISDLQKDWSRSNFFAKGGGLDFDKHKIYFSSFAEVMEAIHDIANENGYIVVEIFPDLSYGGVGYGETKRAKVELEWNGKDKVGKSKKRDKNTLNVQIYRMHSGNYELNSYFSYADGGMMANGGLTDSEIAALKIKLNNLQKKYDYNEDMNFHSENVVLLAKTFGSPEDVKEAKRIQKLHLEEKGLSPQNYRDRAELNQKLQKIWGDEKAKVMRGGSGRKKTGQVKDSDILVGETFTLLNDEVIEIKRLFKENIDEDWVEFIRGGESHETSVRNLRIFINNWRKKEYADGGISETNHNKTKAYPNLEFQKPTFVNDSGDASEKVIKIKEVDLVNVGLESFKSKNKINSSSDSVKLFRQFWDENSITVNESLNVLFLNQNNKPIGIYNHSKGGINGTVLDVEIISAMAVKTLAKGVIICHNHPSGNLNPSSADTAVTNKLKDALKLFDITLMDSMIITKDGYYSLADNGVFELFESGGVTFSDKVKAISSKLENKQVPKKYEKDYGKKYDKKEALLAAQKITGSMIKKMR